MRKRMKILHLEDLPSDAELVDRVLKKADLDFEKKIVDNREDFKRALLDFSPDIILSDHSLPSFDSQDALREVKNLDIKVPFILVTATVSEEYAVNIMKEGASDYILKDRLQRLPNAVLSAMEKYNLEHKRQQAVAVLKASEKKYKLLFESNPMPMWMVSEHSHTIIDVNEAAVTHYGYDRNEFLALAAHDLVCESAESEGSHFSSLPRTIGYSSGLWKHKKKDGSCIMVEVLAHDIVYENQPSKLILSNDISEKLKAEGDLAEHRNMQQKLLTETSIRTQEKERKEIGIELHDNINQILASTKLYLESSLIETDPAMLSQLLTKSVNYVELAIQEIRQLSHKLVPPTFSTRGLSQSIGDQLRSLQNVSRLTFDFQEEDFNEDRLIPDLKLTIYRIVQEQLNNILKHAQAKSVLIRLAMTEGNTILAIQDDGQGFDTAQSTPGIGLRNIANRTELFNGSLRIQSARGQGCTLEVVFPV